LQKYDGKITSILQKYAKLHKPQKYIKLNSERKNKIIYNKKIYTYTNVLL